MYIESGKQIEEVQYLRDLGRQDVERKGDVLTACHRSRAGWSWCRPGTPSAWGRPATAA